MVVEYSEDAKPEEYIMTPLWKKFTVAILWWILLTFIPAYVILIGYMFLEWDWSLMGFWPGQWSTDSRGVVLLWGFIMFLVCCNAWIGMSRKRDW